MKHEDNIQRIIRAEPLLQSPRMSAQTFDETMSSMSTYRTLSSPNAISAHYIGLYACLFMNIGKYSTAESAWSIGLGAHVVYPEYRHASSRLAEDIMVRHGFTHDDIYCICWIIDNIDSFMCSTDLDEFAETLYRYIGYAVFKNVCTAVETRTDILTAQFEKLDSIENFRQIDNEKCTKKLYVLIAASATGKSTLCEKLMCDSNYLKTKYDSLRVELYSDNGVYDYWECIQRSYEDPNWNSICDKIYVDMLETGSDILYDNCNVTKDDRRDVIAMARERGYKIIALTIPIDLETLKHRQDDRRTKLTPWAVSLSQYLELQQPSCSIREFDEIITIDYMGRDNGKTHKCRS